jgi:hypothetical protein
MSASPLPLVHREAFERNALFALGAGALAGGLQLALATVSGWVGLGLPAFPEGTVGALLGLPALALGAAVLACVAGDRTDRALLGLGALALVPAPFLFEVPPVWKLALSGAIAGLLMVQAQVCDRGQRGLVGADRPGRGSFALAALATALLVPAGVATAQVIAWRLTDFGTPPLLLAAFSGAVVALFAALGSLPAHLGLAPDPASVRLLQLLPRTRGELRRLLARTLELYRRCAQGLAALPREPSRESLAEAISRIGTEIADGFERLVQLEPLWAQVGGEDTDQEIARLTRAREAASDPLARAQLGVALESHQRERAQASELLRRRERIVARLEAEVALLGSANLALVQARTGEAQVGGATLGALAQRLSTGLRQEHEAAALADARAHAQAADVT